MTLEKVVTESYAELILGENLGDSLESTTNGGPHEHVWYSFQDPNLMILRNSRMSCMTRMDLTLLQQLMEMLI